jgi:hypothetical protein
MTNYQVQDRVGRNVIVICPTLEEAKELVTNFENMDRSGGHFTHNFYEIVEIEEGDKN